LEQLTHQGPPRSTLTKKEKHQQKREALIQRMDGFPAHQLPLYLVFPLGLGSHQLPSSKSHSRRIKRKVKEQIAGGFSDIQAAIEALNDEVPLEATNTANASVENSTGQQPKAISNIGKIGEGKNATLSKAKRKRALYVFFSIQNVCNVKSSNPSSLFSQMEQLRHPLILSNPEFASNPFQTIRTHAQNTLLKH
jgi:ribosome biogenesis protein SLX9